ncbi:metallophosphoesterase [Zoogloeaceae bacterium G21618-S1]|nr:metallophosphoesterase [Zoogloeaceae bacterium G21618-S1]
MTPASPALRLVHLSDLHFGAQAPGAAQLLLDAVIGLSPQLTLITGDLTQRARNSQFIAARQFFDQLPGDWLAIPGNHDMPLFRPWHRLFTPRGRYRRHIDDATTSHLDWQQLRLALIDSTNPLSWRSGRIRSAAALDAAQWLAGGSDGQLRIAAAHHPFATRERGNKGGMAGANLARNLLIDEGGADLLLWGHLHRSEVRLLASDAGRNAIGIGVGSPTSGRHSSEGLFFHQLDVTPGHVHLVVWRRHMAESLFYPVGNHRFTRGDAGWQAVV